MGRSVLTCAGPVHSTQVRDIGGRTDVVVSLSVNLVNDQVSGVLRQAYDEQGTRALMYPRPRPEDPPVVAMHGLHEGREYDYVSLVFYKVHAGDARWNCVQLSGHGHEPPASALLSPCLLRTCPHIHAGIVR
jgi:hypothetical protein